MVRVTCIKCGREGSLIRKQTISKGKLYEYWYVEHHIGNKIKWCYLGKIDKLPEEYKRLIHKDTQPDIQNAQNLNNKELSFKSRSSQEYFVCLGGLARLGHRLGKARVAGSNPARGSKNSGLKP